MSIVDDIENFSDMLERSWKEGEYNSIKARNIIISGMGGSGIVGLIAKKIMEEDGNKIITTWNEYGLPNWADNDCHLICVSYSGNTAETVSSAIEAEKRNIEWEAITTGGELNSYASDKEKEVVIIENGHQPRAALPLLLIPVLKKLDIMNIDEQIEDAINACNNIQEYHNNGASAGIAKRMMNKNIHVYGSGCGEVSAYRWKCQIEENAKQKVHWNRLPEFNHNEIVGWENAGEKNFVICLRDNDEDEDMFKRWEHTQELIWKNTDVFVAKSGTVGGATTTLGKILELIHLGDWISLELAKNKNIEPEPVKVIEELKKRIG